MNSNTLKLAGEFPAATKEDWLALVDKVLKGADFDDILVTKTYDNVDINPLYDSLQSDSCDPGDYPYTRATTEQGNTQEGWAITQRYVHPSLEENNKQILEDLSRGVTQLTLQFSDLARLGQTNIETSVGNNGIECYSVAGLDALLKDVQLDLVPTQLDSGVSWYETSAALLSLYKLRNVSNDSVKAYLNADPAGALALSGKLNTTKDTALEQLSSLAQYTQTNYPSVRSIGVNSTPYHNAGASHSQEIATALATGVAYLRAMTDRGMDIDAACSQIHFTLSCDTDYFQSIAKLRSMRECWAQVCTACGAHTNSAKISLSVETSQRCLSQRDPWVNVLRGTIASCAAAIGGATSITTACYDGVIGLPSKLSRRISRNTQLLLQDESSIHKIVDPTGGSYFIENHTTALSKSAWAEFQSIEADGGIFSVLESGSLQDAIENVRKTRSFNIGTRQDPLTGVSEFANLAEDEIQVEHADRQAIRTTAMQGLNANVSSSDDIESLLAELQSGRSLLVENPKDTHCTATALTLRRDAAAFESLRDASDAFKERTNHRPSIYLVNIGTPAQYNARAGFITNFFAAGGIESINETAASTPEQAASNWKNSQCDIAVLCSADKLYEEQGEATITALRKAGANHIFIAGNALKDLVDERLTLRSNTLEVLQQTHQLLKVS